MPVSKSARIGILIVVGALVAAGAAYLRGSARPSAPAEDPPAGGSVLSGDARPAPAEGLAAGGSVPSGDARPAHAQSSTSGPIRSPLDVNLVLITLDTTRTDRIGCYGSRNVKTPNLDALAARGVLFETAISAAPLTLPAHCSIFTGLSPPAHGVRDNVGFRLASDRSTLAEVLASRGYATGGFIGAYVLDRRWGIAQGFDRYFDRFVVPKDRRISLDSLQRRGDEVVREGLSWIERLGSRRFFAWLHLYDPHAPYDPPEPYASRYAGRLYDGEIAWTDSLVGTVLDRLDRLGLTSKTIVAVIGDHGEGLGDHAETGHGFFVYESTTHIPFILAGPHPALRRARVSSVVRQVDLAPTLLDLLGIVNAGGLGSPGGTDGRSLVPLLGGEPSPEREAYSESFLPRYHFGCSELRAVRTERYHFIEAPTPELYELASDPAESHNRAGAEPLVVTRMREVLARIGGETGGTGRAPVPAAEDEETRQKLAALGYAGSAAPPTSASWKDLPDPKARIDVYALMVRAEEESASGRLDSAVASLHEALAKDPRVIDAWYRLGATLSEQRKFAQAAEAYRRALGLKADHVQAMLGLVDGLAAEGRHDEAVAECRRFLGQNPDAGLAHHCLGRLLFSDKKYDEAEAEFRRALSAAPELAESAYDIGAVRERLSDFAGAEEWFRKAIAIDPAYAEAHASLARRRYAAGDIAAAAAEMKNAAALDPGNAVYTKALADLEHRTATPPPPSGP